MAYNAMGYPCLVIWEHELTDELAVVAKVEQFMKKIKSYHNKSKKGVICQR
jgi:G:T-mismatch repair DNA endonuclease (very short patch repair protein)